MWLRICAKLPTLDCRDRQTTLEIHLAAPTKWTFVQKGYYCPHEQKRKEWVKKFGHRICALWQDYSISEISRDTLRPYSHQINTMTLKRYKFLKLKNSKKLRLISAYFKRRIWVARICGQFRKNELLWSVFEGVEGYWEGSQFNFRPLVCVNISSPIKGRR